MFLNCFTIGIWKKVNFLITRSLICQYVKTDGVWPGFVRDSRGYGAHFITITQPVPRRRIRAFGDEKKSWGWSRYSDTDPLIPSHDHHKIMRALSCLLCARKSLTTWAFYWVLGPRRSFDAWCGVLSRLYEEYLVWTIGEEFVFCVS